MSVARWWHQIVDPRFLIALIVLGMFAWALGDNPDDDTMKGALIGALNLAAGYYLGSSRGAAQSQDIASKAMDVASAAQPDMAPDVILKPGETAQAEETRS